MKKRLLIIAAVSALSMTVLTGCGSGNGTAEKTEQSEIQVEETGNSEQPEEETTDAVVTEEEAPAGPYQLYSSETEAFLCDVYALPGFKKEERLERNDLLQFKSDKLQYAVMNGRMMRYDQFGDEWEWSWDYVRENGKLLQIEDGQYGLAHGGEYYVTVYNIEQSHNRNIAPHEGKYDITEDYLSGAEIKGKQKYCMYLLMDLGYTMPGVDGQEYPVYGIKRYALDNKGKDGYLKPGLPMITYRNGEYIEKNGMEQWVEVQFSHMENDDWTIEEYKDAFRQIFGR